MSSDTIFKIGPWRFALADDEPTAAIQVAEWLTWSDPLSTQSMPHTRAVIEINRPLGGRNSRALLGGEFGVAGDLNLRVAQSSPVGVGAETSCRSRLGRDLVPGLPPQFAPTVLHVLAKELKALGSGAMTIDLAAYDDVDSSPKAFEHAAVALFRLLRARADHVDAERALEDLVRSW